MSLDLFDRAAVPIIPGPGEITTGVPYRRRVVARRPQSGSHRVETGELPVWPTGAEVTVAFQPPLPGDPPPRPPMPHPVPPPGPPVSVDPPTVRLTLDVRPKHFHPRHRRPLPLPALLTACFGAGGMGGVSVLAVAVAVAQ